MSDKYTTVTEMLNAWGGGAFTTLFGALVGRAMWHSNEARSGRRRFFGPELIWELPIAIGMALIGEGLASYFNLGTTVATGLVAALAYLGPRGAEVLFMRWFSSKTGGDPSP